MGPLEIGRGGGGRFIRGHRLCLQVCKKSQKLIFYIKDPVHDIVKLLLQSEKRAGITHTEARRDSVMRFFNSDFFMNQIFPAPDHPNTAIKNFSKIRN